MRILPFALGLLGLSCASRAQGTAADYERADQLATRFRNLVVGNMSSPHWLGQGERFWFTVDRGSEGTDHVLVDTATGARRPLFDAEALARALGTATGRALDAGRLRLERLEVDGELGLHFALGDRGFRWSADGSLTPSDPPAAPESGRGRRGWRQDRGLRDNVRERRNARSPDGKLEAFVRDHDVWVRDPAGGEQRLSTDGTADDAYDDDFHWSPLSNRLVVFRTRKGETRTIHMVESTPRDQLQPKLQDLVYAKPGDVLPERRPRLFDPVGGREIPVEETLFSNPWSTSDLRWDEDGSRFTFVYNQRGHEVFRIVAVDAETGAARALIDEQPQTFFDYNHKAFFWWLDEAPQLLWMSERSGFNHIHLHDAATGAEIRDLTPGEVVVRAVEHIDEEGGFLIARVMGHDPDQDPYHQHFARVPFDGSGIQLLTDGDGTHTVAWSPDRTHFVDTWSRVDHPPVVELRRTADGARIDILERADATALEAAGWQRPERFVAKGRDGVTDIWGVIWKPTDFDATRRYPVIESIYAGPHDHHVPKSFQTFRGEMAMAELGFVLVKIDGMGTNWRSKAFHDVAWKNLGDAGFPDRIAWMRAAALERPWMDLDRVGIYGGSAGGQNALRAVLAHGDFYDAAAADCGCHDNRMDKVWWNELWMGWPIGPHYEEQSNVTQAHRLTGDLLLTVGELDQNVDPASTMQVVDALIRADKDFELIVFPGGGHGAGGSAYGQRRRRDFFVRSLLGVEPRVR
ncbi:MAG: Dipeptidyl aminopeptidase 4 [Planctomycetota bacterium]